LTTICPPDNCNGLNLREGGLGELRNNTKKPDNHLIKYGKPPAKPGDSQRFDL
jgi:hypothetical protein